MKQFFAEVLRIFKPDSFYNDFHGLSKNICHLQSVVYMLLTFFVNKVALGAEVHKCAMFSNYGRLEFETHCIYFCLA